MTQRRDGRAAHQLRPLTIQAAVSAWAEGSALIQMGSTQVLCTATVEERVPFHRRGSRQGWVTAEYAMLPRATQERTARERGGRVEGRSQEVQRLVARSLRAAVDMRLLGERTVIVDCDVIQADGGTRTAAVNGGFVALAVACQRLVQAGMASPGVVRGPVAAVAVGVLAGEPVLDLDYAEDSAVSTDMNVVMAEDRRLVELQGTAEREPFSAEQLLAMVELAGSGMGEIMAAQRSALG